MLTSAQAAARAAAHNRTSCLNPARTVRATTLCTPPSNSTLHFYKRAYELPEGWSLGDGGEDTAASAGLPIEVSRMPMLFSTWNWLSNFRPSSNARSYARSARGCARHTHIHTHTQRVSTIPRSRARVSRGYTRALAPASFHPRAC